MLHTIRRVQVRSVVVLLALTGYLATPANADAQTPMGVRNVSGESGASARAIAVNNPWFGAQISHRFGTEGGFESNLLAAGQFIYEIKFKVPDVPGIAPPGDPTDGPTDPADQKQPPANLTTNQPSANLTAKQPTTSLTTKQPAANSKQGVPFLRRFHLPVVSNFGGDIAPDSAQDSIDNKVKELLSTASGVTAGLFPYYEVGQNDNFMLTLHGLFAWRYNALKPLAAGDSAGGGAAPASDDTVALHQIKSGIGLEAVIGDRSNGKGGLTVSVTPVMTWFADKEAYARAFGEERSRLGGVEIVGVIPVSDKGVGVVLEGVAASGGKRAFRAGLMIVGKPKS